jgi:tellurite resistance protein TerC
MHSITLLWIIFWGTFIVVSAIDLFVVTHSQSTIGVRSALRWAALWISIAFAFAGAIYFLHPSGRELSLLFISGYLTEYSLSVDNLFVFILIFSMMGVAEHAQPKLIKLGIYLSIALRVLFILFGIALLQRFHWLIYAFGALLVWTAWKMLTAEDDEQVDPKKNLLLRLAAKLFPLHDVGPESRRLMLRHKGRLCITPLFLVFLVIGSTDVLFALDSIPAIMGITQEPFVVLTSNVFAVLGLNSLFFALRGVMSMFKFIKHGVSVILFFIGAKMIAGIHAPIEEWFKIHSFISLIVIAAVLTVSILLSVWHSRTYPEPTAGESKPD